VPPWEELRLPRPGQPPGSARDVGQQVFDLAVDAAQVVVGPALERGEQAWVESE
jgi:hypothetical protein